MRKSEQISNEALNTLLKTGYAAPVELGTYNSVHLTIIQNSSLLEKISTIY